MGKFSELFQKIGAIKGIFYAKMGMIKDRNGKDPTEKKVARIHRGTIQESSY